jgi:hypothetical protein
MVVIGGSGSYTDKFEVIGNAKANALLVVALLTGITKSMVGLSNVIIYLMQINQYQPPAALNLKANLASPTFTGTVSGITKQWLV